MIKTLLIITLLTLITPTTAYSAPLDEQQQNQVKLLIRETLIQNPDIIVEVINELKKRDDIARTQAQNSALTQFKAELFNNSKDPYAGAENPTLSIVYFGDINCGFCKKQDPILESLVNEYPQIRIIYKDLPILGDSSREAAALSLAALSLAATERENEIYLSLHKQLMAHSGTHTSQSIRQIIKSQGLNIEQLRASAGNDINTQLDNNIILAHRLGITGTPALVFPDKVAGGFISEELLKKMIEERLDQ